MTKLEKKYPLVFEAARTLTKRQLQRGLKFYEGGGVHTPLTWRASSTHFMGLPVGAS